MPWRSPSGASSRDGVDVLGGRQALPGERRLVDLERGRRDDPSVRGHEVAGLERDDVAGDQLLGRDLPQLAVPPHPCLDDHHLLERRHGGRGLALLAEAQVGVEDRQQDQHHAGRHLLDRVDRQEAGDQQHDLHRVGVLPQEGVPAGLGLLRRELVGPDLGPTGLDLGRRQPVRGLDSLAGQRLLDGEGVPGGRGAGGGDGIAHRGRPRRGTVTGSRVRGDDYCSTITLGRELANDRRLPVKCVGDRAGAPWRELARRR